jgi:hypothetical protein
MEFEGRILKVLPKQEGVSERTGNAWATQEFVFEYHEHPTDRYADRVLLRTFDTNHMAQLQEGMQVRIGFGHTTREFTKDGKTSTFNEVRLYKFEPLFKPADGTKDPEPTNSPSEREIAPTGNENNPNPSNGDDLPF